MLALKNYIHIDTPLCSHLFVIPLTPCLPEYWDPDWGANWGQSVASLSFVGYFSQSSHWVLGPSCSPGIWDYLVSTTSSLDHTDTYVYSISWSSGLYSCLFSYLLWPPLFPSPSSLLPRSLPLSLPPISEITDMLCHICLSKLRSLCLCSKNSYCRAISSATDTLLKPYLKRLVVG